MHCRNCGARTHLKWDFERNEPSRLRFREGQENGNRFLCRSCFDKKTAAGSDLGLC